MKTATLVLVVFTTDWFFFGINAVNEDESTKKSSSSEEIEDELILRIHLDHNYLSAWNSSSQIVALLDNSENITIIYDGNEGDLFGFLYEEYKAIYLPSNISNQTWNTNRQTYEEYFQNPIPPIELIRLGEAIGYQFDSLTISSAFTKRITEIFSLLSIDYNVECRSFASIMQLFKTSSDKFKTNLFGFQQVMEPKITTSRKDLDWVGGIAKGLSIFVEPFGGMKALQDKKIKLSFERVYNIENAYKLLNYFLNELAPFFDLGKILKHLFNNPLEFFTLISGLSGQISYGFDGFNLIIPEVLKVLLHFNSKPQVIEILKTYLFNSRATNLNIPKIMKADVTTLMKTFKSLKIDDDFQDLMMILNDILEEKWMFNGVNMSRILKSVQEVKFPATNEDLDKIVNILDEEIDNH